MSETLAVAVADLRRRLGNLVAIGVIAEVDAGKALARVKIGELTTTWLPWCMRAGKDKAWFCPDVGEQVLLFAPYGELTQGVIFAGLPKTSSALGEDVWRFEFKDGSFFSFDRATSELTANVKGKIKITGDMEVKGDLKITGDIASTGDVAIKGEIAATGNVAVTGNVTATGSMGAAAMAASGAISADGAVTSGGVDLAAHTHAFEYVGAGQGASPQSGTTQKAS